MNLERTGAQTGPMTAAAPKANVDVRYWQKADMAVAFSDVPFWGKADIVVLVEGWR